MTINAKDLLIGLRDGSIRVVPDHEELRVPPGATVADRSTHPETTLRVFQGNEELLSIKVWGCGYFNSEKPGFHVGYSDGMGEGMPRTSALVDGSSVTIQIFGGDQGQEQPVVLEAGCAAEGADELARELERDLRDHMPPITLPKDHEELDWLRVQGQAEYIRVDGYGSFWATDMESEPPCVTVYAGRSLGRAIYATNERDEVYDSSEEAGAAARRALVSALERAAEAVRNSGYQPAEPEP